jgi:DNA-binding NtrC family response regulator
MEIFDALSARPLILVVDDTGSVRSVLARALLRAGYHVLTASGAADAFALLDQVEVRPDLAIIDLYMPLGSGEELATALSNRHPGLPIVFLSAFGHDPDALLPGLLFEKPFRLQALCEVVTHVLGVTAGVSALG